MLNIGGRERVGRNGKKRRERREEERERREEEREKREKERDRREEERQRKREKGGQREERLAAHLVSIFFVQFLFFLEPLE